MGHGAWGMGHGAWGMGNGKFIVMFCTIQHLGSDLVCPIFSH